MLAPAFTRWCGDFPGPYSESPRFRSCGACASAPRCQACLEARHAAAGSFRCCVFFAPFAAAAEKGLGAIAPLAKAHEGKVAVAVRSLKTGEEYYRNADEPMPTANSIKLAIMVETFWQADEGKVKLDTTLTLKKKTRCRAAGF